MRILDLFCGAGGLSLGFKEQKCKIIGIDNNQKICEIFKKNKIGYFQKKDLSRKIFHMDCDVIIGGPPCRPWSAVNLRKRGRMHPDYVLVRKFFDHILESYPAAFLLENVPSLASDPMYRELIKLLGRKGYSVKNSKVRYSDYGSATRRKRLITVGFRDFKMSAGTFFDLLERKKENALTVGDVIKEYEEIEEGEFPDHRWPKLNTIKKYMKYYKKGKFGWYHLKYDKPAPSFGNVMKTYILHPMAGSDGFPLRVISVREAMAIMGFPPDFVFPPDTGLSMSYQMVADAVSPIVSAKFAETIKEVMEI